MTTQQQTDQPADLGERVAQVEGGFAELSNRVGTLQNSVDSLRAETHADNAALREEMRAGFAAEREERQALREEMRAGFAAEREERQALREEMRAGFAELRALIEARDAVQRAETQALREELNRFKNQVTFFILGSWVAGVTTIGAAIIATGGLG